MSKEHSPETDAAEPCGVVVIDKPSGPTSHDVVMRLRRSFRTRRIGHAGTLDPMASGVLVGLVGEATKLAPYATGHAKQYLARIAFGRSTDTLDAQGTTVEEREVTLPDARALEAAIALELARKEQVPPAFSAIRKDGQRSYDLAREGKAPVLPARAVDVRAIRLVNVAAGPPPFIELEVDVGAGYFVRSLASDLGATLGIPAHLAALRRTASGPFTLAQAVTPDAEAALRSALIPLTEAARSTLPSARLTDEGTVRARQGKRLGPSDFTEPPAGPSAHAWFDMSGELVAIGGADGENWVVLRGFQPR